jgi:hypothetical protein
MRAAYARACSQVRSNLGMSGHHFRGKGGSGLAFNKVLKAILVFPKINISIWINEGHSFTASPSDYADGVSENVQKKYVQVDSIIQGKSRKALHKEDFRNEEHFKSLTEDDGTLNILCKMFLDGLAAGGNKTGANGIFLKKREHSVQKTMHNRTGRHNFHHEVQFVAASKVVCVWKLEAEKVKHGADHGENMKHAIPEIAQRFNKICAQAPGAA